MIKRKSRKSQKLYKMKGCSKTRKNSLGGSSIPSDINLAYSPNNISTNPNPFLSYTRKGGASCSVGLSNLAFQQNINGRNTICFTR